MDSEIYSSTLENTVNEIHEVCPDLRNCFIFNEDGEIVAKDENTSERTMLFAIESFRSIVDKANFVGGVDSIALETTKDRLNVSHLNNLYVVTITSKDAEKDNVNIVAHVLVSTILKLLERITSAPLKSNSLKSEEGTTLDSIEDAEASMEEAADEAMNKEPEQLLNTEDDSTVAPSERPANQFMVESIGRLHRGADTVRIEKGVLLYWQELYEDKKIKKVKIETFSGKTKECKVKPLKNSKYKGKGIVQISEKIQDTLEIKKGELVKVKPIVK